MCVPSTWTRVDSDRRTLGSSPCASSRLLRSPPVRRHAPGEARNPPPRPRLRRLEAVRRFTLQVLATTGAVSEEELAAFQTHGYTAPQRPGGCSGYRRVHRLDLRQPPERRRVGTSSISGRPVSGRSSQIALMRLRETGACAVAQPERLYDLDCPGRYLRRMKRVGFTLA
ncbi:hypothetical protein [Streptomyces sp. NPDC088762]|uniref:Tc toxin subunit A-related protein n=1 Tax=Streptomyces sp. NPDC088762 TaxID=3365891 RepID=UPI00381CFEA2